MNNHLCNVTPRLLAFYLLSIAGSGCLAAAAEQSQQDVQPPVSPLLVRELFIPFEDLQPVLEGAGRRAFLTRGEYEALLKQARRQAAETPPQAVTLISAEYDATVEDELVRIRGRLRLDVAAEGLQAIGLALRGVSLRNAVLDGQPAAWGAPQDGPNDAASPSLLFLEGVGPHDLLLEMMVPVRVMAAQQTLNYELPYASSGRIQLTVPGDVEIKTGPTVLRRIVDKAAGVTRFELALSRGTTSLVMSLNNRQSQQQQVVIARNVLVDEFTETYERLHITASLKVLHGAALRFRFALPSEMEVTDVSTARLSRWQVVREADHQVLDVTLRTAETSKAIINISAERTAPNLSDWTMPEFQPLDVAGSVSVVGLLVEQRLELQALQAENLIPIDVETLTDTLPDSIFASEPGAPAIRPTAAYYAPGSDFRLTAGFAKPAGRVQVVGSLLLTANPSGLEAQGGFALLPQAESIFDCNFSAEPGWDVTQVTFEDGQALRFERYENEDGSARIHVILPRRVPAGQPYSIHFRARTVPPEWLDEWTTREIAIPQFVITEATSDRGAIAVKAGDDLAVKVGSVEGLVPLDEANKAEFQLDEFATDLAFRYDARPFTATLSVERVAPRVTCETYSFLTIQPGKLWAHYELAFEANDARTRSLSFQLPDTTPPEVTIQGLDGIGVKQYTKELVDGARVWTVHLAKPTIGAIRLAVDFQQPWAEQKADTPPNRPDSANAAVDPANATVDPTNASPNGAGSPAGDPPLILPIVQARDVVYQTGSISVEGDPELEIQLTSTARRLDVGELVEANYQPGRRLLGVFGFVGEPVQVAAQITRPTQYGLPTAIVQRAELVTTTATSGISQSAARYLLQSKASFIQVQLPRYSTLWSAVLDGTPAKPQRDGESMLISLPSRDEFAVRDLQLVYETPVRKLGMWGGFKLGAPRLALRAGANTPSVELPIANLAWHVALPPGYRLAANHGSVFPDLTDRATLRLLAERPSTLRPYRIMSALARSSGSLATDDAMAQPRSSFQSNAGRPPAADGYTPFSLAEADPQSERQSNESGFGELQLDGGEELATDEMFGERTSRGARTAGVPSAGEAINMVQPPPTDGEQTLQEEAAPAAATDNGRESESIVGRPAGQAAVPQTTVPLATAGQTTAGQTTAGQWALQGLRSLKINLATTHPKIAFQSLGSEPVLNVTVVDYRRLDFLSWALGLLVLAAGLHRLGHSVWKQCWFVACALILATLLPLLFGWQRELGRVLDAVFWVGLCLIPIYLAWHVFRWLASFLSGPRVRTSAVTGLVLMCLLCAEGGQPAGAAETEAQLGPITVKVVPPQAPIQVPDDVVIIPYNPGTMDPENLDIGDTEKVIVPYDTYLKLLEIAESKDGTPPDDPARPYAWGGATWKATLEDGESLLLRGQLQLNIFREGILEVPFSLSGAELESASVDGASARVRFLQPAASEPAQSAQQQVTQSEGRQPTLLALYVEGKGQKQLELAIRYRLVRRGGWRVVSGALPHTATSAVQLLVPNANTELRLSGVVAKPLLETDRPNQTIETTLLNPGLLNTGLLNTGLLNRGLLNRGQFRFQWRPKIAQLAVDGSLTVESEAVFDIQEDSLRLVWQLHLSFPRSQRDVLQLQVPQNYVIEKVQGDNVRQWRRSENVLDITLLETARDSEHITLHLSRSGSVGQGGAGEESIASFNLPFVAVAEAALHEGKVAIRRSPLLEIRSSGNEGLSRTDLDAIESIGSITNESPLGIQPFQAYRFGRTPFQLRLDAAPVTSHVTAEVQTLLRVSEIERTMESRVVVQVDGSPLYKLQFNVPVELDIRELVAPGAFQWSLVAGESEDVRRLNVFLASGQSDSFSIVIRGMLGERVRSLTADLPAITLHDADRQQTAIVVQTDPSFDVRATELEGCQAELLQRTFGWLAADQRELARLAIHAAGSFRGGIQLVKRAPQVRCQTVSNLRVTPRAFEDTILLDFDIQDAGIRELTFLLPADLRDARVRAKLLRDKTVEELGNDQIRIRLELQDEVMGQFRVLIENDRLITGDKRSVPIPIVETGVTRRRFVALESAGRDEIVVSEKNALDSLGREQQQWRDLAALIGDEVTQAYLVQPSGTAPRLVVQTQDREVVETVGARIPFSETRLTVDQHGAYRGQQVYQVDNRTEQFLEIILPPGARLWTALVADQAVKPMTGKDTIRIPLVKTAAGDQNYPVILKYGGTMVNFDSWQTISFPLVTTKNIKVEESQVRLFLPQPLRWFNFAGTMRHVAAEEELLAGYLRYQTSQIMLFCGELNNANPFARVRSLNNLRSLASQAKTLEKSANDRARTSNNQTLQRELFENRKALATAEQALNQESSQSLENETRGNRDVLGLSFDRQRNGISQNIVNSQGDNFFDQTEDFKKQASAEQGGQKGRGLRRDWIDSNDLFNSQTKAEGETATRRSGRIIQQNAQQNYEAFRSQKAAQWKALPPSDPQLPGVQDRRYVQPPVPTAPARGKQSRVEQFRDRLQRDEATVVQSQSGSGQGGYFSNAIPNYSQPQFSQQPTDTPTTPAEVISGRANQPAQQLAVPGDQSGPVTATAMGQAPMGQGGFGGGLNQPARGRGFQAGETVNTWDGATRSDGLLPSSGQQAVSQPTGLASLDVTLPVRGVEYRFMTPRGDVEITARFAERMFVRRMLRLAALLGVLLVAVVAYRRVPRRS